MKSATKVLFGSYYNYLDQTSGAAISTRALLRALSRRGYNARVFCGPFFDDLQMNERAFFQTLARLETQVAVKEYNARFDGRTVPCRLVSFNDSGVDVSILTTPGSFSLAERARWFGSPVGSLFYRLLDAEIETFKPDFFTTYGGDVRLGKAADKAKERGGSAVFLLHNLSYNRKDVFNPFDAVVVPSRYAQKFYFDSLGLETRVVPPIIDESKVVVQENTRKFLTFINPTVEKGRLFFVRLARELNKVRPDVPLLAVETRAKADAFRSSSLARELTNLYSMETTDDPRHFYRQTRILLVPSLCKESFGRVVVEAGLNEIPVLCSNRGALPEVAGDPRLVLPIPERLTPFSNLTPTPEETAPWLDSVLKLWDDGEYYQEIGRSLKRGVSRFSQKASEDASFEFFEEFVKKC